MKNLKSKSLLTMLMVLALLVATASMAFADFNKFLVKADDGKFYEYNQQELNDSYTAFQVLGATSPAAAMYNQFAALQAAGADVVALGDSVRGWMDYAAAQTASIAAQIADISFVINDFLALPASPVYGEVVTNPIVVTPAGETRDLGAYNTAVAEAATKVEADYTAATWANLQTALATVVTAANTQAEIDTAAGAINAAITALELKPTDLVVEGVTALNLKQVQVTFNQAINPTTATLANFIVRQPADIAGRDRAAAVGETTQAGVVVAAGAETASVSVAADNKSAIITVNNGAAFTNPGQVQVTTGTGLTSATGKTLTTANTQTVSINDQTVPVVESIQSSASNQIRVIFSEPVASVTDLGVADAGANPNFGGAITIDGGAVSVATIARDANNPKALLVTSGGNIPTGNHSVRINPTATVAANNRVMDYATYVIPQTDVPFTFTAGTDVPTVTAVARTETAVRLTFSTPITLSAATANVSFRYAYNAAGAMSRTSANMDGNNTAFAAAVVAGSNNTQYDITFANPMAEGAGKLYIAYTTNTNAAGRLVDGFGNVVPNGTEVSFTVTQDTTAPTVTAVSYVNPTTIDVSYSKVVTGANVATNYTLTNPQGQAVQVTGVAGPLATNRYRLTVASMAAGGNYTLAINNNIRDTSVAQNRLVPVSTVVAVPDTQRPTVTGVSINANRDKIFVQYSEPMGASALNIDSYKTSPDAGTNQVAIATGSTAAQQGSLVTISLATALPAAQTHLVIGQVADVAGNTLANLQTVQALGAAANTFTTTNIQNVRFNSRAQLQFTIDRQLTAVVADSIRTVGVAANGQSASFVNNANGTATVTVNYAADTFPTDLTGLTSISFVAGAFTDTQSLTSTVINAGVITPASRTPVQVLANWDYIAPAIVANDITTGDTDATPNGRIDQIVVPFSEDLYVASVSQDDFQVADYVVTAVAVDNAGTISGQPSEVVITVQEKATPDTGVTPAVTLAGAVQDNSPQRNELAAQAAITSIDEAAPVLVSAAVNYANGGAVDWGTNVGDDLVLTYSEPVWAPVAGWVDAAPTFGNLAAAFTFSGGQPTDGTFTSTSINTAAKATSTITVSVTGALAAELDTAETITGKAASIQDAATVPNVQVVGAAVTPTYTSK